MASKKYNFPEGDYPDTSLETPSYSYVPTESQQDEVRAEVQAESQQDAVSEAQAEVQIEALPVVRCPDDALLSDILRSIIEDGKPMYSSELFVNETFSWTEKKRKDRTLGGKLEFPRGTFVGRFSEVHQFHNVESILDFIKTINHEEHDNGPLGDPSGCDIPFCVRAKVQERFPGAAIGVAGGYFEGEPGFAANILWKDEKTRIYIDPFECKIVNFSPTVIVI